MQDAHRSAQLDVHLNISSGFEAALTFVARSGCTLSKLLASVYVTGS